MKIWQRSSWHTDHRHHTKHLSDHQKWPDRFAECILEAIPFTQISTLNAGHIWNWCWSPKREEVELRCPRKNKIQFSGHLLLYKLTVVLICDADSRFGLCFKFYLIFNGQLYRPCNEMKLLSDFYFMLLTIDNVYSINRSFNNCLKGQYNNSVNGEWKVYSVENCQRRKYNLLTKYIQWNYVCLK